MEMMQVFSGVPSGAGPSPGKMPVADAKGIFGALLNQQQAAAIAEKSAEEGLLAAWWTAAMPADGSAWPVAVAAEEGTSDSSPSIASTDSPTIFPGLSMLPDDRNSGSHPALSGVPVFIVRQVTEGPIPGVAADNGEAELALAADHDQARSGLVQPSLQSASVQAAAILSGSGAPLDNRGRTAATTTVPLGVMEHRFAELLRPVEMTFAHGATGAGQSVKVLPFAVGALPPASEQAAAGLSVQGEFLPSGEATLLDGPASELPGLMANGDFSALRTPAAAAQPGAAETLVAKQPLPGAVTESQILDQVIGRMAGERNQEVSRMSIKLQPEELGRIEIDLTLEQGRIKAQMVAQNQHVQEVLERHLPRLREALEQQGLKLDQIQVSVDAQAGEGRGFSHQQRQGEHHPRTWSGAQPLSAVVEKEERVSPAVSALGRVSLRI